MNSIDKDECGYSEVDYACEALYERLVDRSKQAGDDAYDAFHTMFEEFEGLDGSNTAEDVLRIRRRLSEAYEKMSQALDIASKLADGLGSSDLELEDEFN